MSWSDVPAASGAFGYAVHPQNYVDNDYVVDGYITDDAWVLASSASTSFSTEANVSSGWSTVSATSVGWT